PHRDLPSFPTRRSSDLRAPVGDALLNPNAVWLARQVAVALCSYRITRSSPARRVTRSRSRYSSKGMAYFRVMPVSSLNVGTEIRSEEHTSELQSRFDLV